MIHQEAATKFHGQRVILYTACQAAWHGREGVKRDSWTLPTLRPSSPAAPVFAFFTDIEPEEFRQVTDVQRS